MPRLVLSEISKRYDDVVALDNVSFEVQDGELLVLVGPSGCGKSTTLRLIAGLESLQAGTIAIDGTDITATAPKHRDIAMVFQNYALYPHMTVRQNLGFGLKMKKMSSDEIELRVKETAEALDIESLLDRKPGQLSGGQKQRVAVGRAMIRKPAVFLFDEPLSNLDAKLRVTLRNELTRLHHRLAATILYVTHDQIEALTLGDRIAVMKDGQIQQLGTPQQVYNEPANTFVASFIGNPPMNLVPPSIFQLETDASLVGIRPEHLIISDQKPGSITGTISARQNTGADSFLTGEFKECEITVRASADSVLNVGDTIELIPNPENLHFFNQTGVRISNV
ncbi:MAG: ABC transporter ATP-binding protein [Rhodopirellula sp.]|nr:ABC transporter ATP-binding protein [Rhodopirellula sp.]|tara:strand:- start:812 stop:1822 length:1011 start_codon:yes stop_codon:yes gene_type:complete